MISSLTDTCFIIAAKVGVSKPLQFVLRIISRCREEKIQFLYKIRFSIWTLMFVEYIIMSVSFCEQE